MLGCGGHSMGSRQPPALQGWDPLSSGWDELWESSGELCPCWALLRLPGCLTV